MSEILINLEDYITPEDIKAVAMDELHRIIRAQFSNRPGEVDRLISNLSYEFIFKAVSDAIGEDAKSKVAKKVAELLEDEGSIRYEMWRRKDAWEKTCSPAVDIMEAAIKNNRDLINGKVVEAIKGFEFSDVRTAIYEALDTIIYNKLFLEDKRQ